MLLLYDFLILILHVFILTQLLNLSQFTLQRSAWLIDDVIGSLTFIFLFNELSSQYVQMLLHDVVSELRYETDAVDVITEVDSRADSDFSLAVGPRPTHVLLIVLGQKQDRPLS